MHSPTFGADSFKTRHQINLIFGMWVPETQTYNNGINDWTCNSTLNAIFLQKSKIVKKFIEVQKIKLNSICHKSFFGQNMTSFFYFWTDFNEIFRDWSSCPMVQKYVNFKEGGGGGEEGRGGGVAVVHPQTYRSLHSSLQVTGSLTL